MWPPAPVTRCVKTRAAGHDGRLVTVAAAAVAAATAATTAVATATAAATTTVATATAAATVAAAATTTRTGRALTGLVDRQGPAIDLLAVEGRDGRLQTFVGLHFHETEAARTAGLAIRDHLGASHGAVSSKHRLQVSRRGGPGEVSHVNLPGHKKLNLKDSGTGSKTQSTQTTIAEAQTAVPVRTGECRRESVELVRCSILPCSPQYRGAGRGRETPSARRSPGYHRHCEGLTKMVRRKTAAEPVQPAAEERSRDEKSL